MAEEEWRASGRIICSDAIRERARRDLLSDRRRDEMSRL